MSPADPPAARPWALLDAATDPPGEPAGGALSGGGLSGLFGGVVALDAATAADGRVGALRDGLRAVPDDVEAIVYLDEPPSGASGDLVIELLGRLGDDDGVAAAVPVTDALKRVDGDRVVSSVDRRGLYGLRGPQVLRRSALAAVLASVPDGGRGRVDPAALLLGAGRRVRILPVDPAGVGGPA